MREKIIAGNWKMYTTIEEGTTLAKALLQNLSGSNLQNKKVIVIPPFTHIFPVQNELKGLKNVFTGAQNCYFENEGAFTGEISPRMIRQSGAKYVIIGHSERREYFKETNEFLNKKVKAALEADLIPIYCCGETLTEREANQHFDVVKTQINEGLFNLSAEELKNVIVAYEPVWAIGTGKTASPEQAQEIHAHIRSLFTEKYGNETAENMHILYGGSVKPNNAAELFSQKDIDGGLVGGASLKADDFTAIITAV